MQLRGEARGTAPLRESAVQGRAQRVTPELEYLQAKWAAHLPYRQATELLREVLPLDKAISLGSTRRRVLAVGNTLDAAIERDIASGPKLIDGDRFANRSASVV